MRDGAPEGEGLADVRVLAGVGVGEARAVGARRDGEGRGWGGGGQAVADREARVEQAQRAVHGVARVRQECGVVRQRVAAAEDVVGRKSRRRVPRGQRGPRALLGRDRALHLRPRLASGLDLGRRRGEERVGEEGQAVPFLEQRVHGAERPDRGEAQ